MIGLIQLSPPNTAVYFACPQCGEQARIKVIEPHPVAQAESRTFECRVCGLPRTYVVKPI
jgi:predicted RNA-binding Zn-ribbon protein involved in translation (DUF1610 family)